MGCTCRREEKEDGVEHKRLLQKSNDGNEGACRGRGRFQTLDGCRYKVGMYKRESVGF